MWQSRYSCNSRYSYWWRCLFNSTLWRSIYGVQASFMLKNISSPWCRVCNICYVHLISLHLRWTTTVSRFSTILTSKTTSVTFYLFFCTQIPFWIVTNPNRKEWAPMGRSKLNPLEYILFQMGPKLISTIPIYTFSTNWLCKHLRFFRCEPFETRYLISKARTLYRLPKHHKRSRMLYRLPKHHKRSYKARFIANTSSFTTTEHSKLLTSCLTAINFKSLNTVRQYMIRYKSFLVYKKFWCCFK